MVPLGGREGGKEVGREEEGREEGREGGRRKEGREGGRKGEPLKAATSFAVSQPTLPILAVAPLRETSTTEHILRTTAKFVNNLFCLHIYTR